jgi:signal transduction histidine kinase
LSNQDYTPQICKIQEDFLAGRAFVEVVGELLHALLQNSGARMLFFLQVAADARGLPSIVDNPVVIIEREISSGVVTEPSVAGWDDRRFDIWRDQSEELVLAFGSLKVSDHELSQPQPISSHSIIVPALLNNHIVGLIGLTLGEDVSGEVLNHSAATLIHALAVVTSAHRREQFRQAERAFLENQSGLVQYLQEITSYVDSNQDWTLAEVLTLLAEAFEMEQGAITDIVDDRYRANATANPEVFPLRETLYSLSATPCSLTLFEGAVVAIDDIYTTDNALHPGFERNGIRSYIGSPLYLNGVLCGTVLFCSRGAAPRSFSIADQEFIRLVAHWLAGQLARRYAQEQIVRVMKELQRSNKELDSLAYVASHDLKAPLRAMYRLAQWIYEDSGPNMTEQSKKDMRLLINRCERMEKLLKDLLDYARAGRIEDKLEPIPFGSLLEGIIDLMPAPPGIKISLDCSIAELTTFRAPLEKIVRNLLGNAIKHHDREEGAIHISAHAYDAYWEVKVTDDGPGIDATNHDKAFQMFTKLHTRDEVEGSGMGLAMVKATANALGGTIAVLNNSAGRGVTFCLQVPWPRVGDYSPSSLEAVET